MSLSEFVTLLFVFIFLSIGWVLLIAKDPEVQNRQDFDKGIINEQQYCQYYKLNKKEELPVICLKHFSN